MSVPLGTIQPDCNRCDLRAKCSQVVWGEGPAPAVLMVVAERPGDEEDLMGRPFAGREGQLVRKMLADASLADHAYLTYAVKCAAPPAKENVNACREHLWKEIQTVSPAVILTMGSLPTNLLLGPKSKKYALRDMAGQAFLRPFYPAAIVPWHSPNAFLQQGQGVYREAVQLLTNFLETLCGNLDQG